MTKNEFLQIDLTLTINLACVTAVKLEGGKVLDKPKAVRFVMDDGREEIVQASDPQFRDLVLRFLPEAAKLMWGNTLTTHGQLKKVEAELEAAKVATADLYRRVHELHAVLTPSSDESLLARAKAVMAAFAKVTIQSQ